MSTSKKLCFVASKYAVYTTDGLKFYKTNSKKLHVFKDFLTRLNECVSKDDTHLVEIATSVDGHLLYITNSNGIRRELLQENWTLDFCYFFARLCCSLCMEPRQYTSFICSPDFTSLLEILYGLW